MWLRVQGRGRGFKTGQHNQLVEYLGVACPLSDDVSTAQVSSSHLYIVFCCVLLPAQGRLVCL